MKTSLPTSRFGDLPVGTLVRLENCYGTKIAAIEDAASAKHYAAMNSRFDGWNFRYCFMGMGLESLMSLSPDCEVVVLDKLPACYGK